MSETLALSIAAVRKDLQRVARNMREIESLARLEPHQELELIEAQQCALKASLHLGRLQRTMT